MTVHPARIACTFTSLSRPSLALRIVPSLLRHSRLTSTMAHKHNRRRVRHRSRRDRYDHTLPTVHEVSSCDSLSSSPVQHLSFETTEPFGRSNASLHYSNTAILRNCLDLQVADGSRPHINNRFCRVGVQEARALQRFGGEPGEDYDLVENMQKMFDSTYMEWVNT